MDFTRARTGIAGLGLAFSLVLTACSSAPAPAPAGSAPAPAAPAAGAQPQTPAGAKPVYGGTFRLPNLAIVHMDPHRTYQEDQILGPIYDGLVTFKDQLDYNEFVVVPALAEKWDVSADGKTYTFKLRAGVKFHSGDPMNADDVVYSLERFRAKDPEAVKSYYFASVDTITKVDDLTVRISLKEPFAPLLNYLAQVFPSVVSKKTVDANGGNLKQVMNGTGPFKFVSYESGSKWIAEKNPDFWGKDDQGNKLPYMDKIEYIIMPDYASRTAAFRARESDLQDWYRGPDVLNIPKSNPDTIQLMWTGLYNNNYGFNMNKKPFDDVRVRRAFALAMDRRAIAKSVNVIGPGYVSPLVPASVGKKWTLPYDNDLIEKELPYMKRDLEKARALLKEAGFASGMKVTVNLRRDLLNQVSSMEVYKDNLKEIGVDLAINGVESGAMARALATKDFEITASPRGITTADPDDALYGSFYSGASANYGSISDPKVDELILKQRRALNDDERLKAIRELEKHIADQAYWLIGTDADYASSWQPWVKNFKRTFAQHVFLRKAWIDKK